MVHASLFSGIGGFDLAAERMGWKNVFHCEINPFGQQILKHYWPNATSYADIKSTNFTVWRNRIDILTGGFPCQPFSVAGLRKGTEDDRHLWPEMLRAVSEIKPRWIVGENVSGIVNWNGGMVFEQVHVDLENEGYEVQPYILPACAVNAPHKRDRTWFIAYSASASRRGQLFEQSGQREFRGQNCGVAGISTYADSFGRSCKEHRQEKSGRIAKESFSNYWTNFPTQPPICGGDDGLPAELDRITFPKWRNESIKGYGNAIVPEIAYRIYKAIEELDKEYFV